MAARQPAALLRSVLGRRPSECLRRASVRLPDEEGIPVFDQALAKKKAEEDARRKAAEEAVEFQD